MTVTFAFTRVFYSHSHSHAANSSSWPPAIAARQKLPTRYLLSARISNTHMQTEYVRMQSKRGQSGQPPSQTNARG